MKKFIYIISFLVLLIVGLYSFVSSTYFFNKYIAKNIKEYGFNYTKVNGALFRGFEVTHLSYKNRELSSKVELKINPLKLINGVISVNKLHLIDVSKDVLEDIVSDFKPAENNSSSVKIDLNFEFKNILLTIKPFVIDNIEILQAMLKVDKISYSNYKFYIGNLEYKSKSNIADVSFKGQFRNKILKIIQIDVNNLDSLKLVSILKSLKSDKESRSNSELLNSPFTPKVVEVKDASLTLIPFKLKEISLNNLNLNIKDAKFNVDKLFLEKANLDFNYQSQELDIKIDTNYKNNRLAINSLKTNIKKPNRLETLLKSIKIGDNNSSNDKIIPLNSIYISNAKIKLNHYKFQKEVVNKLKIDIKDSEYNLLNKELKTNNLLLNLDSTLANIKGEIVISDDLIFNNINIISDNIDKIIKLIPANNEDKSTNKLVDLPKKFIIKKLSMNGKNASFKPFIINEGYLLGENIEGKIDNLYLNKGKLEAYVKSPWGEASLKGDIKKNNFYAKGFYKPKQKLLDEYSLPLKAKNFEKLLVDGRFGFESLDMKILLKGKDILKNIKKLDILSSKNRFIYNYKTSNLIWKIDANINYPIIKKSKIKNTLVYKDNKFSYFGTLEPNMLILLDNTLNKLLQNLKVKYKGNTKTLNASAISSYFKASFTTNYKSGKIKIENLKNVKLSKIFVLPIDLKDLKISGLLIKSNLNFNKLYPIKGDIKLTTNLLNLNGKWNYNKILNSKLLVIVPKSSILLKKFKNIKYNHINKFDMLFTYNHNLEIKLKNRFLNSNIIYNFKNSKLNSKILLNGLNIDILKINNNLKGKIYIGSIKKALDSISKVYTIKTLNANGKLNIDFKGDLTNDIIFTINSSKIVYKSDNENIIENLNINSRYSKNSIKIDKYSLNVNGYKIFSNKNSLITINNNKLNFEKFWINDSLNLIGYYNIDSNSGKFDLNSNRFELDSQKAKVAIAINSKIFIKDNKKDISGTINILEGKIKNAITRKNVADNEDIIILQRKKEKENTNFAKNIKLNIKITSSNSLVYTYNNSYIKITPNMTIKKNYNTLSDFRGVINIEKDSYYTLNGKKLIVTKGVITFKGKSSSPNINIDLKYEGKEYIIYINISGTPNRTVLYFRSNPPLTKEQILAYLLFDDSSAVGTHNKEAMLNMIGGSLAKSFLGSIGIKLDHIAVKENGFSIGKNVSKNITVYYNQDGEKSSVKTRIDITKSIHTDLEVGKDKQSIDIIFSNEY